MRRLQGPCCATILGGRVASNPPAAPSGTHPECSYIKQCLGSPTPGDYEAVVAERDGLQRQLEEANQMVAELQSRVRPGAEF